MKLEIETWILKIETINFGFGSTALSFVFNTFIFGASSALFWALRGYLFGPLGLFLGSRSGSKTILEPTNVDYQFLFWKYSPIFLFLLGQISGLFSPFGAIFRVVAHLHRQTVFYFGSIALSCFLETFPSGWVGVVGKSDFNENPVVSLDLDLDFGLWLRVCQKQNEIRHNVNVTKSIKT